jgi:hypothetical protein
MHERQAAHTLLRMCKRPHTPHTHATQGIDVDRSYNTVVVNGCLLRDTQTHQAFARVGRGNTGDGCVGVLHLNTHSIGQLTREDGGRKGRPVGVDNNKPSQPPPPSRTVKTIRLVCEAFDKGTCGKEALYWHNREGGYTEAQPCSDDADRYTSDILPEACGECNMKSCVPDREEFKKLAVTPALVAEAKDEKRGKRKRESDERAVDDVQWEAAIQMFEKRIAERCKNSGSIHGRVFPQQARAYISKRGFSVKQVLHQVEQAREQVRREPSLEATEAFDAAKHARASLLARMGDVDFYGGFLLQCMSECEVRFKGEMPHREKRGRGCACKGKEDESQSRCGKKCGCVQKKQPCSTQCRCRGACGREVAAVGDV